MVILDAWNIWTSLRNKLLDYKNLGLFKIIRVINNLAYKLKLPLSINTIFLVFYPWFFYLDKSDPLPRQIILPPTLIWFDENISLGKYVAKKIFNLRINKRRKDLINRKKECLIYKIKFIGWDEWNTNPDWQVWIDMASY